MIFNFFLMLSGGVCLLIVSLFVENGNCIFSGISFILLLYLVIIGLVVGFFINIYLLKKWYILKVMVYLFILLVIVLYVGFVFLGEILNK